MGTERVADSAFLAEYKSELDEVFQTYLDVINPFIIQFEILKNEFPVELQNEIRAIYGHLSRASVAEDEDQVRQNIQKMKSHTKRALLDCYKYSCIIYTDGYMDFFERYKGVDLSYVHAGRFLPEVHDMYKTAAADLQAAKCAETSNMPEEDLVDMYERAYLEFLALNEVLEEAIKEADFLKHRATRKDIISNISFVIGAIGLLLTVISLI